MTEEDIRRIVREAVHETLGGLGIEAGQQHEVQADFLYIRRMRKGSEAMGRTIRTSTIALIIPTIIYILWHGFKDAIWR